MRLAQGSCAIAGIGGLAVHPVLVFVNPKDIELESTGYSLDPKGRELSSGLSDPYSK